MSAKPTIQALGNGRYAVNPVDDADTAKIPGLKAWGGAGVEGYRDSIAVLWKRLTGKAVGHLPVPRFDGPEGIRDYQVSGISWLLAHLGEEHGALLGDDMGLGKTMQTTLTWEALGHPSLAIVCPASVRRGWVKELRKWANTEALLVEKGDDWLKYDGTLPVITSYQLIQKAPENFMPDMVVIDEIQNCRGRGAKQARWLLDLSRQATYRLGLTGTPMWSRPNDLWMVFRILFPNYRFGMADDFDLAYCNAFWNRWGGKVNKGSSNEEELALRLKYVMLRRTKQDVKTELPPVTRVVRYVEPTAKAALMLRMAMVGSRTTHDALVETLANKMDAVIEAVIDSGANCLVATWMKEDANRLVTLLEKADKSRKVALITGDVSHKNRELIIAKAAALPKEQRPHIVATTDSTGVGVDGLQYVTSNLVLHALDYVPIKVSQLLARLDRLGQIEPVTATFVVMKDSMDDLVMSTIVEKLDQWTKVMGKDDNTAIRDTLVDGKRLKKMEEEAVRALYESFGKDS